MLENFIKIYDIIIAKIPVVYFKNMIAFKYFLFNNFLMAKIDLFIKFFYKV